MRCKRALTHTHKLNLIIQKRQGNWGCFCVYIYSASCPLSYSCNRIRQEKNGGAWCPKAQISSDIHEYLEVDLTQSHLITWTETQGRFGNGQGQEYAEQFFIEYWRDDKWHQYKNLKGNRVNLSLPQNTEQVLWPSSVIFFKLKKPEVVCTNYQDF